MEPIKPSNLKRKTSEQIQAGKEKDKSYSKKQKVDRESGGISKVKETSSKKESIKATPIESRSIETKKTSPNTSNTIIPTEGGQDIFNIVANELPAKAL